MSYVLYCRLYDLPEKRMPSVPKVQLGWQKGNFASIFQASFAKKREEKMLLTKHDSALGEIKNET